GVLVTAPQTPIYQARASLELQAFNENFMNLKSVDPTSSFQEYSPEGIIQTQMRILQSETLLERVTAKLNAEAGPEQANAADRVSAWRKTLGLPEPPAASAREKALRLASSSLKVRNPMS